MGLRACLGIYLNSGRSLRSARRFGNELRASAAPRLRPATPLRAQMKNEELKMKNHHEYSVSTGRSLRRANRCAIEFVQKSPQPSGGPARADLRDARMQPSARGRRLPVTAQIQHSKLRIQSAACGLPIPTGSNLQANTSATTGCGPPVAPQPVPLQKHPSKHRTAVGRGRLTTPPK